MPTSRNQQSGRSKGTRPAGPKQRQEPRKKKTSPQRIVLMLMLAAVVLGLAFWWWPSSTGSNGSGVATTSGLRYIDEVVGTGE